MTSPAAIATQTDPALVENEPRPSLLGLSHIGITVRDMPAAQQFWTSVMGFVTLFESGDLCMFAELSAGLAIATTNQEGRVEGPFDERRVGLDHLALAVPDVANLRQWERRLTELGVPHDPVTTSDAGHHLNLRAPDNFPIELFVLTDEGAASLGLKPGATAVAGGHRLDP